MAIQIIHDQGFVTIPEKTIQIQSSHPDDPKTLKETLVFPERTVVFKDCVFETRVSQQESQRQWRPDLTATLKNDATLYAEVAVTHESEIEKTHDLDNLMEIDLSRLPRSIVDDPKHFENQVLNLAPRKWFRCSLYDDLPIVQKKREALREQHALQLHRKAQEKSEAEQEKARLADMRFQYADQIRALRQIITDSGYKARMEELATRSEQGIAYTKQRLNTECWADRTLPDAVLRAVQGDWLFNGHPIAWQGFVFDRFVYQKDPGTRLHADRIAEAVVQAFGMAPWASDLLAQGNPERFCSPSIAFLSDDENWALLKPEVVIGYYLESLSRPPMPYLKTKTRNRQYAVRFGSIEQKRAADQAANEARKAEQQAAQAKAEREAAELHEQWIREEKASVKNWLPEPDRWERNVRRIVELKQQGIEQAYLCQYCHCPFEDQADLCLECGVGELRNIHLTNEYVASFGHRLQTMPRIRTKKDYRDE